MEFVEFSQSPGLSAAALVVALAAGFTGLTLTKDLGRRSVAQKKLAVAMGATALGGGIWSMHFVAMLGLQMPILFAWDAAVTLISALLAILVVGAALLLLHFVPRSAATVSAAGALVATGILSMHFIGMAGLELCRPVYTIPGVAGAILCAYPACILAFRIAYGRRSNRNILLGALCFGLAVSSVHFAAVAGTRFVATPSAQEIGPLMSNEVLALGVISSSFVIFGAFLWTGVTFLVPQQAAGTAAGPLRSAGEAQAPALAPAPAPASAPAAAAPAAAPRIPCEKDGTTLFLDLRDVAFVRAEGHFTHVYAGGRRHYCAWSITEAARRLLPQGFLKVHRSYLVNPARVIGFERRKDNGLCRFDDPELPPAPVSRSNLKTVREALG